MSVMWCAGVKRPLGDVAQDAESPLLGSITFSNIGGAASFASSMRALEVVQGEMCVLGL